MIGWVERKVETNACVWSVCRLKHELNGVVLSYEFYGYV